jgi:hypothetical protein
VGLGDIFDGRSAHGVDFAYECTVEISPGVTYAARWTEPQTQLEVLVPVPDQPNRYYACPLATDVKPQVYVNLRHGKILGE